MNQALWQAHLEKRVGELVRENERLRLELRHQRARAERWRKRAEILAGGPSYLLARMWAKDEPSAGMTERAFADPVGWRAPQAPGKVSA